MFNGYSSYVTMSPKEVFQDDVKKSVQELYERVQTKLAMQMKETDRRASEISTRAR